jgi:hypothetical protein
MRALECALADAHAETVRLWRAHRRPRCPSELGRVAELAYAASAGLTVWQCVPRWLRAAIHGGGRATTRDRGVDAVGFRDGRLVLAQVKWYHEGACVSGDADMKLALIAAVAHRKLDLAEPPRTILVMRRGTRAAKTSPGTGSIEYLELGDDDLGLGQTSTGCPSGSSRLVLAVPTDALCPFEEYRYTARARKSAVPNIIR